MSQATQDWVVADQQKFLSRIGSWFRRNQNAPGEQPLNGEDGILPRIDEIPTEPSGPTGSGGGNNNDGDDKGEQRNDDREEASAEPRRTIFRPWAKRDHAIENLHRGIGALTELLVGIRENMEKQSKRQDELMGHLAALPEALRAIPEAGRVQGETLKAIQKQIERQTTQQSKLGDVLDRINQSDSRQGMTLDALHQTVAGLNDHDQAISRNLQSLGMSLESVSNNSSASAHVLEQLRDNTARRDGELERVIRRQNTRFTTLLTVAIVLSIAALTTVAVFGYLAYEALMRVN